MQLDIGFNNADLWHGVALVGEGRARKPEMPRTAATLLAANADRLLAQAAKTESDDILLTGTAPLWAWVIMAHAASHHFNNVCLQDPDDGVIVVSTHKHHAAH